MTKNIGIKRYNQRQLKEVLEYKEPRKVQAQTKYNTTLQTTTSNFGHADARNIQSTVAKLKKTCEGADSTTSKYWERKLIPGRIYNSQQLY